jgi:alkylated DNA repair dioxygenase AlkB
MTQPPITYLENFIDEPSFVFDRLWNELNWERRGLTPRREYYANDVPVPYGYGKNAGYREYLPQIWHPDMLAIREKLEAFTGTKFEVCFVNGYEDQSDFLGAHADDSEEMDDSRPIAIISLGAAREIWFHPQTDKTDLTKVKLGSGSLCLMHAGMQDTHFHRIPKAGFVCGERLSLTFRGYVAPARGA